MLSKLSVKKPFTVLVGIALVLILGYVSLTKMSTDLLPSMNLNYAIIITTDMGATPEEVEKEVTAPIEAAMATMTDIENVSSQSYDNYSMVVLEFAETADMNALTVDMRESLDSLKSSWSDSVGNPTIMKINPDMMPVLISAVSKEDMTATELTEYVKNDIVPEIESVPGVASVSVSGEVETTISVTLDTEKIETLNKKVKKSLDKQFKEALDEIEKAKKELSSQSSQLSSGKTALTDSTSIAINQLTDQKVSLMQTKADLQAKIVELQGSLTGDPQVDAMIQPGIDSLQQNIEEIDAGIETINENLAKLNAAQISGAVDLGSATAQMANGQTSLDEAEQSIKDAKESAYASADLTKILTEDTVGSMLMAQNFDMPAGYVTEDGEQYLVRVGDDINDIDTLSNLILLDLSMDGIDPIYLSDIATVEYVDNSDEVYTSVNGQAGILLSIEKQTGYSTGDVSNNAKEKMESLMKTEEGLSISTIMDQGVYIDFVVDSVVNNMLVGGILAIIILLLFLRDIKPTLVVAVSIPVSLVAAIVLMYFSGVNLNIISLSGLALGVGMLVDNSIVVIENIYRLRADGMEIREAAVKGAKQVTGAIIASTLTTACVFLPIVFTEGITRQLFVDMGLTVAYSLLASLVIAITFVPMMGSVALGKIREKKEGSLFEKLQGAYRKALEGALRYKVLVLLFAIALLAGSIYGALQNGTAFMNSMESTQMTATLTMPKDASLAETAKASDEIIEKMLEIEDVETVGAMTGSGSMLSSMSGGSSSTNQVTMYLIVSEDKSLSNQEIADLIMDKCKDIEGELSVETSAMDLTSYMSSGLQINVKGRDLDKLQEISSQVLDIVESTEGCIDIESGLDSLTKGVKISVDKEKAAEYSLTVAQVYQTVAAEMAGNSSATSIATDTADYEVYVASDDQSSLSLSDIENITFTFTNSDGEEEEHTISEIAEITETTSLSSINRSAQTRYVSVTAAIDADHNIGLVSDEISNRLKEIDLPEGIEIEMAGEDETINDAMSQLMLMLIVAVAFIYLIMVAQFQSLVAPFIIMFTIPLAFTGGFLALMITGSEVSVIAVLGFVMLSGIIVNNGIVLVDFINQLRREGMTKHEAILTSGVTRVRPIMMTALTTILAMSTMALGMGMGADMVQPMAIVIVGGMIYGTLMTLFVVPCIYDLLHREKSMVVEEIDDDISDLR